MLRHRNNRRKGEQGGVILEFALTFPLLLLLTVGLLQWGLLAYGTVAATNAARQGARMGSVALTNPSQVAYREALKAAREAFPLGTPRVKVLAPGGVPGTVLAVRVEYRDVPNFLAPLGALFPGLNTEPFTLRGEAVFRQEGW